MSRRGRRRRAPGSAQALPVEAPASTREAPGNRAGNGRPDEMPTGQSEGQPLAPRQTAQQTRPDDASLTIAQIRQASREIRLRRARRRALAQHVELSPVIDLLDADSPEGFADLAAEVAAHLGGGEAANTSSQAAGPPVVAGNPAIEAPEEADLDAAVAEGNYKAIASNPALRAEYKRRYMS